MTSLPERNLDVLRSTAVLCVVTDHLVKTWDTGISFRWALGRMGVLLFFVHTSLVLMSSLEREGSGRGWVRAFYVRRAFRIYPLAVATILGAVLIAAPAEVWPWWLLHPSPFPTVGALVANLTLSQNLTGHQNVLVVLWSLPLEVQMYLLLPACFLVAARGIRPTLLLLAAAVAAGLLVRFWDVPGIWRLSTALFAPCFVSGIVSYAMLRSGVRPRLPAWLWVPVLAACIMLAVLARLTYETPERGWPVALAVGLAIPLVANLAESWFTRAAKTVCTYSYGIYLVHQPILWIAFTVLHGTGVVVQWATLVTLGVLVPVAAYRFIERPGILLGKRLAARWRGRLSRPPMAAPHAVAAVSPP